MIVNYFVFFQGENMKVLKIVMLSVFMGLTMIAVIFADYFYPQSWPFNFWSKNKVEKEIDQRKEVSCDICKGTGKLVQNYTELMAIAKCQIYFANHARKCDICKKCIGDDLQQMCEEASKKVEFILNESKKQSQNIQKGDCYYCGGAGKYWEYKINNVSIRQSSKW
jgi:RecJ-like exonuclease